MSTSCLNQICLTEACISQAPKHNAFGRQAGPPIVGVTTLATALESLHRKPRHKAGEVFLHIKTPPPLARSQATCTLRQVSWLPAHCTCTFPKVASFSGFFAGCSPVTVAAPRRTCAFCASPDFPILPCRAPECG